MAEWQPIESAPKDGTRILSFGPDLGDRSDWPHTPYTAIVIVRWIGGDWHDDGEFAQADITHWMPLPDPPEAEDR